MRVDVDDAKETAVSAMKAGKKMSAVMIKTALKEAVQLVRKLYRCSFSFVQAFATYINSIDTNVAPWRLTKEGNTNPNIFKTVI